MNIMDSVRAHAARATWASVCAVLLAAVAASAASQDPKQEHKGHELPVIATVPTDEAVRVRPDTAVSFQLDTRSPAFRAIRQQLESGRFALQVEGGDSTQLFLGTQRDSAGEATFDAGTGTVSTPALSLRRYTTYTVTLAVKAAYEALLQGQPPRGNDSLTFAFVTGSALNEPTHYQLAVEAAAPRVSGKARLTVVATDDYGNPAWGSSVSVRLSEDGSRLASSAQATPAHAPLPESGAVSFDITNTEAEGVQVSLQAEGSSPENAWSGSASLRFRPEVPAQALLSDLPAQAKVGTPLTVKGSVVDRYGNAVEDGETILVIGPTVPGGGQSTTTQAGAFSMTYALPTRPGSYFVQVRTPTTVLASADLQLLPGEPAGIDAHFIPPSVIMGSSLDACGTVRDAYRNTVLDGTPVTVNGLAASTRSGVFCVKVTVPRRPGTFEIVMKAGGVTLTKYTQARSGPVAAIKGIAVPSSVETNALFQVCAMALDAHDNPVADGTPANVQGGTLAPVWTSTSAGRFCGNLKAPNTETSVTVTLTVQGPTQVQAQRTTYAVAPPPARVELSLSPVNGSVPANGTSSYVLTASVTDSAGRPVADNIIVSWFPSPGTTASSASSRTVGGKASVRLSSSVAGTATVTAAARAAWSTLSVTFTPPGTP